MQQWRQHQQQQFQYSKPPSVVLSDSSSCPSETSQNSRYSAPYPSESSTSSSSRAPPQLPHSPPQGGGGYDTLLLEGTTIPSMTIEYVVNRVVSQIFAMMRTGSEARPPAASISVDDATSASSITTSLNHDLIAYPGAVRVGSNGHPICMDEESQFGSTYASVTVPEAQPIDELGISFDDVIRMVDERIRQAQRQQQMELPYATAVAVTAEEETVDESTETSSQRNTEQPKNNDINEHEILTSNDASSSLEESGISEYNQVDTKEVRKTRTMVQVETAVSVASSVAEPEYSPQVGRKRINPQFELTPTPEKKAETNSFTGKETKNVDGILLDQPYSGVEEEQEREEKTIAGVDTPQKGGNNIEHGEENGNVSPRTCSCTTRARVLFLIVALIVVGGGSAVAVAMRRLMGDVSSGKLDDGGSDGSNGIFDDGGDNAMHGGGEGGNATGILDEIDDAGDSAIHGGGEGGNATGILEVSSSEGWNATVEGGVLPDYSGNSSAIAHQAAAINFRQFVANAAMAGISTNMTDNCNQNC